MIAMPYTTKSGTSQFRPKVTAGEVLDGTLGFCLACGEDATGVEPDARKYVCTGCGYPKVYGLEELVLMGLVIVDEDEGEGEEEE